jgi:hypothetical protein
MRRSTRAEFSGFRSRTVVDSVILQDTKAVCGEGTAIEPRVAADAQFDGVFVLRINMLCRR